MCICSFLLLSFASSFSSFLLTVPPLLACFLLSLSSPLFPPLSPYLSLHSLPSSHLSLPSPHLSLPSPHLSLPFLSLFSIPLPFLCLSSNLFFFFCLLFSLHPTFSPPPPSLPHSLSLSLSLSLSQSVGGCC